MTSFTKRGASACRELNKRRGFQVRCTHDRGLHRGGFNKRGWFKVWWMTRPAGLHTRPCAMEHHFMQTWCRGKKQFESELLCNDCHMFSWRSYSDPDFMVWFLLSVKVLATSSTTWCTSARHVIQHMVYQCSPRHPPHGVPVLAASSTTWCTGARHVIHHMVYRCSPRHSPRSILMLLRRKDVVVSSTN